MFNFYLYNKSYEKANIPQLEENFRLLNDLVIAERAEEDFFWMSASIWDCVTSDGNFADVVFSKIQDKQLLNQVLPRLFQAIPSIPETFLTLEEFDRADFHIYNAFYGVFFDKLVSERYINNKATYLTFKNKYLWDINPRSLWERREMLFSKLILCPDVEHNLEKIGSSYFTQIVSKLTALDRYVVKEWIEGKFDYRKAIELSSLNIHPESNKTMDQKKYQDQRKFKLPDGTIKCFELHILTGDLRIYFYPDNGKIYIGHIGKHLSTVKF
jgi:hypothetical protein